MAITKISEERPTIAAVALDLRQNCPWLGKVLAADVVAAAKRGGVTLRDGRVRYDDLATIYFNLCSMRGVT